jgi:Zn-dependent protease with chaperone function
MTLGSDKPFIVITTGLVDLYDHEEMRFAIAHELGHALSGHAVYRTMLFHLTRLATRLAWFAVGYISLRVIIAALRSGTASRSCPVTGPASWAGRTRPRHGGR